MIVFEIVNVAGDISDLDTHRRVLVLHPRNGRLALLSCDDRILQRGQRGVGEVAHKDKGRLRVERRAHLRAVKGMLGRRICTVRLQLTLHIVVA